MKPLREARPLSPAAIKSYRKLSTKHGRLEAGTFLVEGIRAVRHVAGNHSKAVVEILATPDAAESLGGFRTRTVESKQIRAISQTRTPQGALAVVRFPADAYSARPPERPGGKILLLEGVQDPGNVGTLLRTAAAFDFSGVILSDQCADPFSAKVVQASAGALLSVWIRKSPRHLAMASALKRDGYFLITADLRGKPDAAPLAGRDRLILALGSEATGASNALIELSDHSLLLPIDRSRSESLNVAACGAILMYLSTVQGRKE
jgi:TrmH family RNA methyltransferase